MGVEVGGIKRVFVGATRVGAEEGVTGGWVEASVGLSGCVVGSEADLVRVGVAGNLVTGVGVRVWVGVLVLVTAIP